MLAGCLVAFWVLRLRRLLLMMSAWILLILVSIARRVVLFRRYYSHVSSMMWLMIMSVIVSFIFMLMIFRFKLWIIAGMWLSLLVLSMVTCKGFWVGHVIISLFLMLLRCRLCWLCGGFGRRMSAVMWFWEGIQFSSPFELEKAG
jgi:hypothetical protein